MIEEGEFVIFYRDRKKNSDWKMITNDYLSKRKFSNEKQEQYEICRNIIDNAYKEALNEHGISTDVFYDAMIINIRQGKMIGEVGDDNIISYDAPEED